MEKTYFMNPSFRNVISQNVNFSAGLLILTIIILTVSLGPFFIDYDPNIIDLEQRLLPPNSQHIMGTDELGRDLFARVLYGGRISVFSGLLVVLFALLIGTFIGISVALAGGIIDTLTMRVVDIAMSIPPLILAMALAVALGPSLQNAMIALTFVVIPGYIRLSRGIALGITNKNFVKSAQLYGASRFHIVSKHLLPNVISPITVAATLEVGAVILSAASLSFLGLGVQPPIAEWGGLISSGRPYFASHWWYTFFPGMAILVTAIGFNLLGDGLRDLLDPRGTK